MAGQIVACVGASRRYEDAETNEDCGDMRGASWYLTLYVRPATEDQSNTVVAAEKIAAEKAEAEASRKAMATELDHIVRVAANHTADMPPRDGTTTARWSKGLRLAGSETYYVVDGLTWYVESSYDDCHQWCVTSVRAAELVALLGGAS
jgi:hypothetical protein